MERSSKRPLFCIVDASSFIFRAYYAVRPLSNKKGLPTNAIFGFASMIVKVLEDFVPEYIAIVYDTKHPSFRKELYSEYKANRSAMPEDLQPQIPYIKKFVETLGLPAFERVGFEADDVIATLADEAALKDHEADVCIISSDKDLMQLVTKNIFLYDTMKELRYDEKQVEEKLGVPPKQVPDLLGLVGDSSDNIPGVDGVGPKTAIGLLQEFGSIEGLYENLAAVKKEGQRKKLEECKEKAFLSKKLATVRRDLNIGSDWHSLRCEPKLSSGMKELLDELEFTSVLKRLEKWQAGDSISATVSTSVETMVSDDLIKASAAEYVALRTEEDLQKVFTSYAACDVVVFDTETTALSIQDGDIVGYSFCCEPTKSFYVPLQHRNEKGALLSQQIPLKRALELFREFCEGKKLVGQNLKFDINVMRNQGILFDASQIYFDTMLASFVLEPQERHNLDSLTWKFLNHTNIKYSDVCGTGKSEICFDRAPIDKATSYAAEDAHVTYFLWDILSKKLEEVPSLQKVFREIDLPLVKVLSDIEWEGVEINAEHLERLSREFTAELQRLEKRAIEVAGEEFNLASPKQLSRILFEKLQLPIVKKTKTGFSTDVDVLEKLALQHELPAIILEHRELSKLLGTYVDVLPGLRAKKTNRVHAGFHQTVAATGRLSSSDPNLQNIPIRTESGKRIREAFIAKPGCVLLGADYSQIELRILAFMSGDASLAEAFRKGEDIHTLTASQIFSVEKAEVNSEQRRKAKAINFGILYGKSAFSLAEELGISRMEASDIIKKYFARYPTVKAFLEGLAAKAKQNGYAETIYGRRRRIEGIDSKNKMILAMAERMAVNSPIQGTAADLMKMAMISVHRALSEQKLKSKLIIQVHDELLLEVPHDEVDTVKALVKQQMEGAGRMPGFVQIDVPLTIDMGVAENWLKL